MPVSLEILTEPIGSQYVQSIGANDPATLNDFAVYIVSSENATGMEQSHLSVSSSSNIVSFEGRNSVWKAIIRPPQTAGVVTLTVAQNAVSEGNPETSKDIRVSTSFPDTDAETPTELLTHAYFSGITYRRAIAVSPTRIYILTTDTNRRSARLQIHNHQGAFIEQSVYLNNKSTIRVNGRMDYFNGNLYVGEAGIFELSDVNLVGDTGIEALVHTEFGVISDDEIRPYGADSNQTLPSIDFSSIYAAAHQAGLLYLLGDFNQSRLALAEITAVDSLNLLRRLNIDNISGTLYDIALYQDTLYLLRSNSVHTLDIRKYRPLAKNTKTNIPIQFANEGDIIPLTPFCPDAEKIIFDVNSDKPDFLSINSSNELEVASNAVTETTPIFVLLRGINHIDSQPFSFYLVVQQATAPKWRDTTKLTMRANSSFDLFHLLETESGFGDTVTIQFRSGRPRLVDSSLSNGVFRIGTTGGVAEFTARKGSRSSHIRINIDVVQVLDRSGLSDVFDYRAEIAGIDVTDDVEALPSVSETLDPVLINEYRVSEASITLLNKNGKYSPDIAGNFWETHNLNPGGFQNAVKICTRHFDGSNWIENLLFSGMIIESFEPISEVAFRLNCVDISSRLRNALVEDFGTLQKWDALRRQSDEDNFEGIYVPNRSLLPIQPETVCAWSGRTELEVSRLQLPSEGIAPANTAYATQSDLRTSGGYLDANPIAKYKTQHRSEDVRFLINQLATNKGVFNTQLDIPGIEVANPFILNRGSVPFSVENTRITRLPVDWVYDSTNDRVLILLSNLEAHLSDLLVQYDLDADTYRILHTFDRDIKAHRIERRNSTNYYILTSKPIAQDRSAPNLPRTIDSTGYAYDAVTAAAEIKIYHYSTTSGTLAEHVAEDDSYPPQLGIHYWTGFENAHSIDAFEGIVPSYRGAFKWQSNNLYYRYAKDGEFGVARVDVSGTTSVRLNSETDVDVIYCVDDTGDEVFVISAFSYKELRRFTLPAGSTNPKGITVDDNYLYCVDQNNFSNQVLVFDKNTADGTQAIAIRTFDIPAGLHQPRGITVDGNTLYCVKSGTFGNAVLVFSKNTADGAEATEIRSFSLPGVGKGITVDGDDLYVIQDSTLYTNIAVYNKNTADGTQATAIRTFDISSSANPTGITVNSDTLHYVDSTDDNLIILDKNTADGTQATEKARVGLPSGLSTPVGVTYSPNSERLLALISSQNNLNFAFNVNTSGTVYMAYAIGNAIGSALVIKSRTSSGTETQILYDFKGLRELTALDSQGGAYLGCYECLFHDNHLYMLCPVGRVDVDDTNNRTRSVTKAAGMVLYRCNVTASSPTLTTIETWDFATRGACNLIVHDGAVHFVENPPAASKFKPINPDLNGYWTNPERTQTMGYNLVPENQGQLKRISSSGAVERLGNLWYTDRPYNIAATRCLSIGRDLHLTMGYGNLDEVLRLGSLASAADNVAHIVYGRTLHYVLPEFKADGSVYDALAEIAKKINATLSFEKDIIMIADRSPYRAMTDGATGTGTGNLSFENTNKSFPDAGFLLIGKEILQYSGISGSAFTGITRGVLGSPITNHTDGTPIVYLDAIIRLDSVTEITRQSDTNRIYNIIRDSNGIAEVRDEASIKKYGERPYTLDLGLTHHEKIWSEQIYQQYLAELKDLQQLVNLQTVPYIGLGLGQIVPFFYDETVKPMRIVAIRYEPRATHITGRTL